MRYTRTSDRDIDYDLQIITIADNSIGALFIIITILLFIFPRHPVETKPENRTRPIYRHNNIIRFIVIYETNSVILYYYYTILVPTCYYTDVR